ncbi:ATP-binding protein [Thalassotalea euphylliae]|uniref:sensor histidine kinase n=1 Tax=Thalassotalea euphylliae TaxID=1655234 RepID=UPI003644BCB0
MIINTVKRTSSLREKHLNMPLSPIHRLSVKQLTITGFALVFLLMFVGLFYLAEKTKVLASDGAEAIYEVSALVSANRELDQSITRAQRHASQYIVLKDSELLDRFTVEHFNIVTIIDKQLKTIADQELNSSLSQLEQHLSGIATQLPTLPEDLNDLDDAQLWFSKVTEARSDIKNRSEQLIAISAADIKNQSEQADSLVLKSLLIVPVSLAIAGIFVVLITRPLKKLTNDIKMLERGSFDKPITSNGSVEIIDIANALETMRTRLQALELQKSSFIRHISHEVKTPLAAIREGTSLLEDNSVGPLNDGQQEISHIIQENVFRLQQLIEDLLDFNIVLDSTSLQDNQVIDVKKLVHQVIDDHQLNLQRKSLTVSSHIDPIQVHGNTKHLAVILENLLSNAIKFAPDKSELVIKGELENSELTLSVSDQGVGIALSEQAHIFDAFYQGKTQGDSAVKSSGLGLTIVKELVMRLNGQISVSSIPEEQTGTTFTVTLPRAYAGE